MFLNYYFIFVSWRVCGNGKLTINKMSSYIIKINENNLVGKRLIDYLKSLSKTSNYIEIMPQKDERT